MLRARSEWELADSFVSARYWLPEPYTGLSLTFDHRAPNLGGAARVLPLGAWAIVSAENPWSIPREVENNAAAMLELQTALRACGLVPRPMRNSAPGGAWAERSVLVQGLRRSETIALCGRFGQAAAVFGVGEMCGLLWTRTERWVVLPARVALA